MAFAVVEETEAAGWQPKMLVLGGANRRVVKQSGG
jgi:aspartate 1-decarboxylase